jgi:hypothetical protein
LNLKVWIWSSVSWVTHVTILESMHQERTNSWIAWKQFFCSFSYTTQFRPILTNLN